VKGSFVESDTLVWIPIDLVFYPLITARWRRKPCIATNSSGVAAFADEQGARDRGLLELIERHALMRLWLERTIPGKLSPEQLPYHWQRRVTYWRDHGRTVDVLDISTHGIVVICVIIRSDNYPGFVSGAAASAESFEQAVAKAFLEAEAELISLAEQPKPKSKKHAQVKTVVDHVQQYAFPAYAHHIKWLWSGEYVSSMPTVTARLSELAKRLNAISVRLSPSDAPLAVVRVLSDQLVPMSYGFRREYYTHPAFKDRPELPDIPHFFG
jgi:ribosomal protein S12 methylthiotransferase accessory factor YcaO